MPTMTYDGRSFFIDGKRIWIVSAGMQFQRHEPAEWEARLRQIAHAGFNTVETPIYWNMCEPRPGKLAFTGRSDIAAFAETVQKVGLKLILRVGPFIGSGWDLGGLPAWLSEREGMVYRSGEGSFLDATGKYLAGLAKAVRPLQVGTGGPLILLQIESNWSCADPSFGPGYLGELGRLLRESGVNVTRVNSNNLWLSDEGDVEGWVGSSSLLSMVRQLARVRSSQPRLVVSFAHAARPVYGEKSPEPVSGLEAQRRLAEALAAGGQFNISTFAGGLAPGFWSGQASFGEHTMLPSVQEVGAAIDASGRFGESYGPLRRLALFASSFGRVFASLDPDFAPVVADPVRTADEVGGKRSAAGGFNVVHARGTQGEVVFLFSPDGSSRPGRTHLLLSDGSPLAVETGGQAVHWCVLNVNLSSQAVLDYSTFCVLTHSNDTLVLFGREGASGAVSINGTPVDLEVPKGDPLVEVIEGVTVVLVSEKSVDTMAVHDNAVYCNVDGFEGDGTPIPAGSSRSCVRIVPGGESEKVTPSRSREAAAPKDGLAPIETWKAAGTEAYTQGTSPRFAKIGGPSDLTALGAPLGYGWYRVAMRSGATKKYKAVSPLSGDRLHMFLDGEANGVMGIGPGAEQEISLSLKKGTHTLTVLADNAGRVSGGSNLRSEKGLLDHLYDVKPLKPGRPKVVTEAPVELLSYRKPLFWVRQGDTTSPHRVQWSFQHRRASPVFVRVPALEHRVLAILNGEPIAFADAHQGMDLRLDAHEVFKRGGNVFELVAAPESDDPFLAESVAKEMAGAWSGNIAFLEGATAITDKGEWSFAKWEPPANSAFKEVAKSSLTKQTGPTWWKAGFELADRRDLSLVVELSGMTKGQLYINGEHIGRYFVATADGTKVPPVSELPVPASLVRPGMNELMLFDEHGGNPGRVHVRYLG